MPSRPQVLMISKPVVPPWNDSAKNIVKDQVAHGRRYGYRVLTTLGAPPLRGDPILEPLYSSSGTFAAGLRQNFKVMLRGLRPRGARIYHYFFAPNPLTSKAGRIQKTLARVRTVQTICSAPASFEDARRLVFTDRVVTVSRDTRDKLAAAGVAAGKIVHIPPGIEPIAPPSPEEKAATRREHGFDGGPLIVFPGDLEFSSAADTVAAAAERIVEEIEGATLVFACRIKRPPSARKQEELKDRLASLGERVRFINQVEDMPRFIGAADLALMPAESLYAKMDMPLVLLEAMSQGVPLVLADCAPLDELVETGAAVGVPPGDPDRLAEAARKIVSREGVRVPMAEAGMRAVRETFSAEAMASTVEELYDEL